MKILKNKAPSEWTRIIFLFLLALALALALFSYDANDPSFSTYSQKWEHPKNYLGYVGSWLSDLIFQGLGYSAWLLVLFFVVAPVRWFYENKKTPILTLRGWAGLGLLILSTTLLTDLLLGTNMERPYPPQGWIGIAVSAVSVPFLGKVGAYLLAFILFWSFCLVWWETLPFLVLSAVQKTALALLQTISKAPLMVSLSRNLLTWLKKTKSGPKEKLVEPKIISDTHQNLKIEEEPKDLLPSNTPVIRNKTLEEDLSTQGHKYESSKSTRPSPGSRPTQWVMPSLQLLHPSKKKIKRPSDDKLLEIARRLSSALASFDVAGEIVEITWGPTITIYEFQPAPGVSAKKIMSTSVDLAMTLGAPSVRVVAPIPGKSVVGIEVPNTETQEVLLRDVYENTLDQSSRMKLPLILGKDAEGRDIVEDLSRMPHLLVGGATNMGKSVFVNSIVTGLLCRFNPDELKMIVVDPKLVEFKIFEDIPHLLHPIVNEPDDANQALKWAVAETKRRYLLLQKFSVKNIEGFNKKIENKDFELKDGEETPKKLPYIVIIIDELAELMATAKKEVETSIVRLTQLARAAGVHLIMATQRPSADVVTGLIKSNCPARAALRVASATDSRIILDCSGAEQLLGRGDLFFTNTGPLGLRRMQGCYVSDEEIERICDHWRSQAEPEYLEDILKPDEPTNITESNEDLDSLFKDVVEFAREKGKISTSLIQRRFQIGYTRAARIMEQLEAKGIVGEQSAAGKPRDVLL